MRLLGKPSASSKGHNKYVVRQSRQKVIRSQSHHSRVLISSFPHPQERHSQTVPDQHEEVQRRLTAHSGPLKRVSSRAHLSGSFKVSSQVIRYHWRVLPFGISMSPWLFSCITKPITQCFHCQWIVFEAYIDDCIQAHAYPWVLENQLQFAKGLSMPRNQRWFPHSSSSSSEHCSIPKQPSCSSHMTDG